MASGADWSSKYPSKSTLMKGMSNEEKKKLKQELKFLKMKDISSFMESLPPDFVTILCTDGLLRSLCSKSGAPHRVRLLVYDKNALYGHFPKLNPESDFMGMIMFSKFKTNLSYLQFWLLLETVKEASSLQELRFLKVKGGYTVHLRRWSPRVNKEVLGKFRGGWIELRGLPFHLWFEVHLKKIVDQWGMVIEIDWRTLKLFDLSKARVRILMKERIVLPALIEVINGGWVFTISATMVGAEDKRRVRGMGESTQGGFESHSWTCGRMLDEKAKCWSLNGVVNGIQGGVESQKDEDASDGTHGKRSVVMGNSCIQPSSPFNLNSNKEGNGSFGPKLFGEDCSRKGKAHSSFEDWCRASNMV
ncbi:hypothetical protein VitviT2T_011669 [Vitis vinifera]|uniref:DUF4283 domain-containing protein n=1 Tax=Vitis vinifera TaxID=29760 RepID=A0ABY9CC92_VITVI|nr:hypothetical protein VitviT2T_011669 [Vitis vinifera]